MIGRCRDRRSNDQSHHKLATISQPSNIHQLLGFLGLGDTINALTIITLWLPHHCINFSTRTGSFGQMSRQRHLINSNTHSSRLQYYNYIIWRGVLHGDRCFSNCYGHHLDPTKITNHIFQQTVPSLHSTQLGLHSRDGSNREMTNYLINIHFTITIDHDSLKNFLTQRIQTLEQQKYPWRLLGYKYKIVYWLGKHNVVVDALSRWEEPTPPSTLLQLLSTPISNLVNKVNVDADKNYQHIRSTILIDPARFKDLSIRRDLLLHRDAIVVSFDNNIRRDIFDEGNSSMIGGHSDQWCMISRIFHSFYWHKMTEDVKRWLRECAMCHPAKSPSMKPLRLLQPLPPLSNDWEAFMIDFMTNLPLSSEKSTILVVIDRLSKGAHFIPLNLQSLLMQSLKLSPTKSSSCTGSHPRFSQTKTQYL